MALARLRRRGEPAAWEGAPPRMGGGQGEVEHDSRDGVAGLPVSAISVSASGEGVGGEKQRGAQQAEEEREGVGTSCKSQSSPHRILTMSSGVALQSVSLEAGQLVLPPSAFQNLKPGKGCYAARLTARRFGRSEGSWPLCSEGSGAEVGVEVCIGKANKPSVRTQGCCAHRVLSGRHVAKSRYAPACGSHRSFQVASGWHRCYCRSMW